MAVVGAVVDQARSAQSHPAVVTAATFAATSGSRFGPTEEGEMMTRNTRARARMVGLAGMVMFASTACQIPVGNPLGIPLVSGCTLFIGEPAQGTIAIDVVPGAIGIGCNIGL